MNTMLFKYVIEVERTRSITQAAENLFMAQPNLSKAIKELEQDLGFAIFQRTGRGMIPTPKGNEFLAHAHSIAAQLEKVEAMARPGREDSQAFGISIPRGSYIARGFIRFAAELDSSKGIDVTVQETNSVQTIGDIAAGRFNLGIIRFQKDHERYFMDYLDEKQLLCDAIWEFEYLLLMSRDNPLAWERTIGRADLAPYTEIVHGDAVVPYLPASEPGRQKRDAATPLRRISLYERFNQFELLSAIKDMYMWVSPIPEDLLERYGLVQRRCADAGKVYRDMLVYPQGYQFTALDKQFIDCLYASKNEVSLKEYR